MKYFFYWTVAISLVGWSWTTLYVFSYGHVYGGMDESLNKAVQQKKSDLIELAAMEERGAPLANVFDQQLKLSMEYAEGKDYDGARKMLHQADEALLKLPETSENFVRRLRIAELVAHTYMDQGLYGEARSSLDHASDLAKDLQTKYFSEDGRLFSLVIANERGVLNYLEANCTLDGKERAATFASCQTAFEKLLAEINSLEAEPKKLSEDAKKRLARMKSHVQTNLNQVKEDIAHEGEFQRT